MIQGKFYTLIAFVLLCSFAVNAQFTIHCWDFNGDADMTSPLSTEHRVTGNGSITHTVGDVQSFAGSTVNACDGSGSGSAFCPRPGVDLVDNGSSFTMSFPTTGYENIEFSFWFRRTASGFNSNILQYSTNGGLTFDSLTTFSFGTDGSGTLFEFDFSTITTANDNPDFQLRVILLNATGATGNNRYDNVTLKGSLISTGVDNPVAFAANTASASSINLGITPNAANNNLLIAVNTENEFGTPVDGVAYLPGSPIAGGGTVIYADQAINAYNSTGLQSGTMYYYKIWSYNAASNYSAGLEANATTAEVAYYQNGFSSNPFQNGWSQYSVSGAQTWTYNSNFQNVAMSPFSGGCQVNEDWLITIPFDLTGSNGEMLYFDIQRGFAGDNDLLVYFSVNYSGAGDPNLATWIPIDTAKNNYYNANVIPNNTAVTFGPYNVLQSVTESLVYVAFKFDYSTGDCATWRVSDLEITVAAPEPTLLVAPFTLSGLNYEIGDGPSEAQAITVSGDALTPGDGTINVSAADLDFEVSMDDINYSNSVQLIYTEGELDEIMVYVRLKAGLAIGEYTNQELIISGGGADNVNVMVSGEVMPESVDPGWQITETNIGYIIDFDNTVEGVNLDSFSANSPAAAANPTTGQLNANAWDYHIDGSSASVNDPAIFPGTFPNSNGPNVGGSFSTGINVVEIPVPQGGTGRAFGIQPTGGHWSAGSITLRAQNKTGAAITALSIAYDAFYFNDQPRGNEFFFMISEDNINYSRITELDVFSPGPADESPVQWVKHELNTIITNLDIAPNDFFYLRWAGDDFEGGGARDEFAFDNIVLSANPVIVFDCPALSANNGDTCIVVDAVGILVECECQVLDCAGIAGGEAFIDNCGDCVGGTTELIACEADCNGVFGGTAEIDDCGVCLIDGPLNDDWNASCTDCAGIVNGEAFIDNCGDCVGGTTELEACVEDCNGVFGGTAEIDDCGVCVAGGPDSEDWNASCTDCAGVVNGEAFIDNCGDCVGGTTELAACEADCDGVFGGTAEIDDCGVCVAGGPASEDWNASCTDCAGIVNGEAFIDNCGDCVGGTTELAACEADCNGVFGGTAEVDDCGICIVDGPLNENWNASCTDCAGIVNGEAFIDNCGDCVGGTTELAACEADCNGVFGGAAEIDDCGVCVAGGSASEDWNASCTDCAGIVNGEAFIDNCGDCVGGTTDLNPCDADCEGVFGGTAEIDPCGDCISDGPANPIWGLACLDTTYVVSGSLITADGDPIANATVSVAGMQMVTPANGEYMFTVDTDAEGSISVEKDINPLNGITTLDVVLIQQHVLGIESLSSPYAKIAADINANGIIEIGDILQLRRMIIMLDSDFINPFTGDKNNTSWVFVKPGVIDPSPTSSEVPEYEIVYDLANLGQSTDNLNFIGVKIGDVNQTASGQGISPPLEIDHRNIWQWNVQDISVAAGSVVEVDITSNANTTVHGFQAEIALNGLSLISINSGTFTGITQNHYNVVNRNGTDYLLISWSEPVASQKAGETLFTLALESKHSGNLREMLNITSNVIRSEAYFSETDHSNIQLNFLEHEQSPGIVNVATYPNPFSHNTSIQVDLSDHEFVMLAIYDVFGKLIYTAQAEFAPGVNSFNWTPDSQVSGGVYLYTIQAESKVISGRLNFLK